MKYLGKKIKLSKQFNLLLVAFASVISFANMAIAQSPINYVEYYVDQDPGFGNAISIPVTAATTITNATFTVDVASLSKGIHILASRARTASGVWSMGHYWFIFKPYDAIVPVALSNIVKVEYYIDQDPGLGLGTNVTVASPATDLVNLTFSINPTTLSKGVHIVGSRALDATGKWSATNFWLFVNPNNNINPTTTPNITTVEYFVDADPGIGNATPVSVAASTDIVNNSFTANIASLRAGTHIVGTRAKDANGSWSLTNFWLFVKPFTNITPNAVPNITAFEYFLDYDLGFGKGTAVAVTAGTNLADVTFNVDLTGIIPGTHYVVARAKDANGNWSMVNNWQFTIPGTIPSMTTIVSATTMCAGGTVNVGYQLSSAIALKTTNQYIAQISDQNGSFKDPITIGTKTTGSSSTSSFTCTIPSNLAQGGAYRIRVVTTDQSILATDNGTNITIYDLPKVPTMITPMLDTTVCKGNQLKLQTETSTGYYQWLLNNNPIANAAINNNSATSNIYIVTNASIADTGTYRLRISNYSSSTCFSLTPPVKILINTNVTPIPTMSPSGAIGVCLGNASTLTSSTATIYQWYKDDVIIAGANGKTYNASNAGIFTVRTSNGNTCYIASSNNAVVTLGLAATKPSVVPSTSTTFCQGGGVTLTSSAFSGNQWLMNGVAIAGQTSTSVYVTQSGFYKTVVTGGGCSITSDSLSITVNPYVTPSVVLASSGNNVPSGTSLTFTATPTNGGISPQYSFTVNSVVVQNGASNIYATNTLTSGAVVGCTITSNANCVSPTTATANNITITFSPPVVVSGRVYHPSNAIIPTVLVKVGIGTTDSVVTDAFGKYSFMLNQQLNYSLTPFKNNDQNKTNGVNVLDVIKMQHHILTTTLFNNPYKVIAADVNSDGNISVLDVILTKRLILGMDTSFNGKLWAFVDSSATFSNPNNPFPFANSRTVTNLNANKPNQSFIGVKLGDVTQDWTAVAGQNRSNENKNSVKIFYDKAFVETNNNVRIKVRVKDFKQLLGLQFAINFNQDIFKFVGIENKQLNIDENTILANNGTLSFLWTDPQNIAKSLNDGSYIFDIILAKKQPFSKEDISLNNQAVQCVAFNKNFEELPVVKQLGTITNELKISLVDIKDERMDAYPNPTNGNLNVTINSRITKRIEVALFDINGKIVFKKYVDVVEGSNQFQINLNKQTSLSNGIYYLKSIGIDSIPMKEVIINKTN
jgi:hypothetical protein